MNVTDLLDDLASGATPARLAPADLWAAGRRRRTARRARAVLLSLAGLGVLALLLPSAGVPVTPGPASSSSAGVQGYPERIGKQWLVRDLPDRPGPVAALLQVIDGGRTWQAVRSDGHRWRLPQVYTGSDAYPALSPDGRLLGSLSAGEGPYVVQDLVTGERTEFPGLTDNRSVNPQRGMVGSQSPSRFSPDGRSLLLPGIGGSHLLDVRAGTSRRIVPPGTAVGWLDDDRLVWLDDPRFGDENRPGTVDVVTTDTAGRELDRTPLVPQNGTLPFVSQWTGSLGSDGLLALLPDSSFDTAAGLRTFSLGGQELGALSPVEPVGACGAAWAPGSLAPTVPVLRPDGALVAEDVRAGFLNTRTVVARQLEPSCLVWAEQALAGPGRGGGLLGTEEWAAAWWWRELLLVAIATGALTAWVVRRGRRGRRSPETPVDGYA